MSRVTKKVLLVSVVASRWRVNPNLSSSQEVKNCFLFLNSIKCFLNMKSVEYSVCFTLNNRTENKVSLKLWDVSDPAGSVAPCLEYSSISVWTEIYRSMAGMYVALMDLRLSALSLSLTISRGDFKLESDNRLLVQKVQVRCVGIAEGMGLDYWSIHSFLSVCFGSVQYIQKVFVKGFYHKGGSEQDVVTDRFENVTLWECESSEGCKADLNAECSLVSVHAEIFRSITCVNEIATGYGSVGFLLPLWLYKDNIKPFLSDLTVLFCCRVKFIVLLFVGKVIFIWDQKRGGLSRQIEFCCKEWG